MTPKRNTLYKHISCLDIDILVIAPLTMSDGKTFTRVRYWNRHLKQFQGESECVWLPKMDPRLWSEVKDAD